MFWKSGLSGGRALRQPAMMRKLMAHPIGMTLQQPGIEAPAVAHSVA